MPVRIGADRPTQRHSAHSGAAQRRCPIRVAQPHTARTGDGKGLLGAARDRLALGLGDQSHYADSQVIGFRHVHGEEPHPAVAEGPQEGVVCG